MIKYLKPLSVFVYLFLSILDIYSQGQTDFLDILSEKFRKYCSSFPREEVYVHTDRGEYIAGEVIWFKIYLFDRQTSKLAAESSIAYFEILNPENRPVVQKRIKLVNGSGQGHVALPDTISSGNYTMRTYTNWMRNFMPDNCFIKTITIHNALNGKIPDNNSIAVSSGERTDLKSSTSSFMQAGLNVEAHDSKPENIEIVINTDRDYRLANGGRCYLFIQTHGVINFKSRVNLSDDTTRIYIPKYQLIHGITHITVFNSSGRPASETFIYTPVKGTTSLAITSRENFLTRDKIELGIEVTDESSEPGKLADLSISVAPAGNNVFPDIADYMIFGSEFEILPDEIQRSGIADIPEGKLEKLLAGTKSNWIDWDIILSGEFPVLKYKRESENHFLYGRLFNRNSQTPEGNQYLFLSMPGKNATFQYAKTDENGDFFFTLPVDEQIRDLIIQPEAAERNNNIRIETSFSDKYPQIVEPGERALKGISENISKLAINYQVMKIYRSDNLTEETPKVTYSGGSKRFYGIPDIELVMDDYIKLPVMQEVFFELMPGVMMRKVKSEYEITIANPVGNRIYDKPPILFMDGVVVKDPDIIADLDPELVEKVDAIRSRYFVGDYMFYGLVNVITRAGDFSNITLPDYAVRLPYRVTEPARTFTLNDYSSPEMKQSRIPDFRNTLYWNPAIPLNKNVKAAIEFWTSDFRCDYAITIQGISTDGELVSAKKIIKVE